MLWMTYEIFHELVVCNGTGYSLTIFGDLGVCIPQAKALFDVQVTDIKAASFVC